ncbi:MAG: pirin family protein [Candidatus Freyarchaeum deiterrae]
MISIRKPESIYQSKGDIENGTFRGRWHFSFDQYYDPKFVHFGTLRVFNDDTLSPGAVWPLHPHRDNEVVTYCAEGEFRHADEHGKGGILKKGWVQHTTVGKGMWHSEINNLPDSPMRFIQMWFIPSFRGLEPSVEQKKVLKEERTNKLLPLVSNNYPEALKIKSDAEVYSCFLETGKTVSHTIKPGRGCYLYILEEGSVKVNDNKVPTLGAAMITDEASFNVTADRDAEFLLVDVLLVK